MSELELYKFIQEKELEIDWRGEELMLWVDFYSLREFGEMISNYLDDGGHDVNLQQNCMAFDIVDLCEHFGIDPEKILEKPEDDPWT